MGYLSIYLEIGKNVILNDNSDVIYILYFIMSLTKRKSLNLFLNIFYLGLS